MKITPLEIQQRQFTVKFRGFDIEEVDIFLEQVAVAFESLQSENEKLHTDICRFQMDAKGYREREETFKRAILNSQQVVEQMRENAHKSAELIVADAEVKAEKILNRAHNRLSQLHEDIAELKRQRIQIEAQIRAIVETHVRLLEMGKEEMRAMDEEDSKLKLLKHPG